ncbi:MAG: haloacid dehalogenase-like hydrolase [Gammaproteobacteria bacterium]|nr:haloacid dehalogenase-like hydrolase [Gammaproteobacteria bacterium]
MLKVRVFDLCGTLINENTTFKFVRYCLLKEKKWIRLIIFYLATSVLGKTVNRFGSLFKIIGDREIILLLLKGFSLGKLSSHSKDYVEKAIESNSNDLVMDFYNAHIGDFGVTHVIASASIDIVVKEFSNRLHADSYIASKLEFVAGKCTGKLVEKYDTKGKKQDFLHFKSYYQLVTDNYDDIEASKRAQEFYVVCDSGSKDNWLRMTKKENVSVKEFFER